MGATLRSRVTVLLPIVFGICFLIPFTPRSLLAQITFERTYGGVVDDFGHSVQQTSDGGYIIVGYTSSFGGNPPDVYLVKTDFFGDTVWTRTYGGVRGDYGYSVQQTRDGGYIIAGGTYSFGTSLYDVYLIRTDSLGDTLWTRTYGGSEHDLGYCVQQTRDKGYIIVGETNSFSGGDDAYLIKTNSLGDTAWTRTYGGASDDHGYSVQQTKDGGYIIAGATYSFGAGYDVYLITTDSLGDTLWTRTYGGSEHDLGHSVQQTKDGGYIIGGGTMSFGGDDVYLIRMDSLGETLWTRTCGGIQSDYGYSVQQTLDGGYIAAGLTASHFGDSCDVYLVKTDSVGETLWTRTYGGTLWDWGRSVLRTEDGGYAIAGFTESFGAGGYDFYLIKTDSLGQVVGITENHESRKSKIEKRKSLQNQPNPFQRSTLISYSLAVPAQVTLEIYDIAGRLVETLVNETQNPGIHQVRWDRKNNASSVYFYRLKAGEFEETRKMVVVE